MHPDLTAPNFQIQRCPYPGEAVQAPVTELSLLGCPWAAWASPRAAAGPWPVPAGGAVLFLLVLEGGFWWGAAQKQGFWLLFAVSEVGVMRKCIGWKSRWDQPAWCQQSSPGHTAII